jgi:hypothetical protein
MNSINSKFNSPSLPGPNFIQQQKKQISWSRFKGKVPTTAERKIQLLLAVAEAEMNNGKLPDFKGVCYDLIKTFAANNYPHNALQFIPVLRTVNLTATGIDKIISNEISKHVLVENDLIKIVLIHWAPGESCPVHGHPAGGCALKVLSGKIRERRYSADAQQKLLSISNYNKESIAYIDDSMARHAVENPFSESAITLHAYTPGIYNK